MRPGLSPSVGSTIFTLTTLTRTAPSTSTSTNCACSTQNRAESRRVSAHSTAQRCAATRSAERGTATLRAAPRRAAPRHSDGTPRLQIPAWYPSIAPREVSSRRTRDNDELFQITSGPPYAASTSGFYIRPSRRIADAYVCKRYLCDNKTDDHGAGGQTGGRTGRCARESTILSRHVD